MKTIEVIKGKKWFFRIKGANNQIMAHSEQYESKQGAMRSARSIANEKKWRIKDDSA